MNVIDAAVSAQGNLHLLMEDGAVNVQERVNSVAYQHMAQSARPAFLWTRFAGPDVVVPTRLIVSHTGELRVLGDGLVWERVRDASDPSNAFKPAWIWKELALPGAEAPLPVNPPATVRTEVLTIADGGAGVNATANAKKGA